MAAKRAQPCCPRLGAGTLAFGLALAAACGGPAATPPAPLRDAPAATGTVPATLRLEPCDIGGVAHPTECGSLPVHEDAGSPSARIIDLAVVKLAATGADRRPDPLFIIMGGPGQSATGAAAWLASSFEAVRRSRDIVLVDQRGTGRSNPLDCDLYGEAADPQDYLGDFYPVPAVRACRSALEGRADPRRYATTRAMADLDDVREALGYDGINLYGVSYGTRAVQEYIRRHPERVRAAVVFGVVYPGMYGPMDFAPDAQRALDGVLTECEAEPRCAAAFPGLRESVARLFVDLAGTPATALIAHPATGDPVEVRLSRDLAGEAVRYLLYGADTAGLVPLVLHQATRGDFAPLAEYAIFGRRSIVAGDGAGLYLSITCAEDLPWTDPAEGARRARGTFLGDYRVRHQLAACEAWPRGDIPADFHEPLSSDVPVLLLSGQWDPVTPPANAEIAARHLTRAKHVVIPHAGHGYDGLAGAECVPEVVARFFELGSVEGLDTSCIDAIRRPSFPTSPLPMRPIAIDPAALEALEGIYRAEVEGFEVRIEAAERTLRLRLPDGLVLVHVPVAQATFRPLGLPGFLLEFRTEADGARAAILSRGGVPMLHLRRL